MMNKNMNKHSTQQKSRMRCAAFTLVEVLIVLAIIGFMAALVVPDLFDRFREARVTATKTQIKQITQALERYKFDNHRYPSTDQGIEALVTEPSIDPVPRNWKEGGYIKNMPQDSWDNDFYYEYDSATRMFEIISFGADSEEGGEGDDADISSHDL